MSITNELIYQKDDEILRLLRRCEEYQKTINKIDDFFEYANESESDRLFVHGKLDDLTVSLKILE